MVIIMAKVQKAEVEVVGGEALRFAFAHGAELNVSLSSLTPEIVTQLALHGMRQKIADSYAGADTSHDAEIAAKAVANMLMEGAWTRARSLHGGDLLTAIINLTPDQTEEEVRDAYNAANDDTRKEWAKHPAIKAEVARLKLERLNGMQVPVFTL